MEAITTTLAALTRLQVSFMQPIPPYPLSFFVDRQWTSTGQSHEYITFPIAFTAADTATLLVTPYHSDGATHPTDGWSVSMTSASTAHCTLTGYDLRAIAIGW